MKNRLLSFILILALCLSLVPAAYAEDGEELLLLPEEDGEELLLLPEEDEAELQLLPAEDEAELQLLPAEDEAEEIEEAAAPEVEPRAAKFYEPELLRLAASLPSEPEQIEPADEPMTRVASGGFGNGLVWVMDDSGLLTIKGSGYCTTEYSETKHPGFYKYRDQINTIQIESTVQGIGTYTFYGLTKLTNVSGGGGVLYYDRCAFAGCTALKSVELGSKLEAIGAGAFLDCTSLRNITIPASTTLVEPGAFMGCTALNNIYVASGSQTYKSTSGTLLSADGTTLVCCPCGRSGAYTVPRGVTVIGPYAFLGCDKLTSINLGSSLQEIQEYAFAQCKGITSITIPASVTNIAINAFYQAEKLVEYKVDENSTSYKSADGVLFTKDGKTLCSFPTAKSGKYAIPSGVTTIADCAFLECPNLTGVVIPSGVESIGHLAFASDNAIRSVAIPNSVLTLGEAVFAECLNLNDASVGSGVKVLSPQLFYDCKGLRTATLSVGTEVIGVEAFYNCSALERVNIPVGTVAVGDGAFTNCIRLTSIMIPNSVTYLGEEAFANCVRLASVKMSTGLTAIQTKCFNGCAALKEIEIPDAVTTIGESAFRKCSSMTRATLGSGLTEIGKEAFYECTSLLAIDIPDSVTTLGASAFYNCRSVKEVRIGSSVTELSSFLFGCCENFERIIIPESVVEISNFAFDGCRSITDILFLGAPPHFSVCAFSSFTATAWYLPDKGWAKENFQNYGATLTWKEYITLTDAPELTEAFNSATGVRVSWKPVDGAAYYQLLRKNLTKNETEWKVVGETTECSLIDKTTASASRYTFTVRAVDAIGVPGPCDEEGRTCTFIAKADITNITVTEEGVSLQWSKPAGAKNFRVMRRVDGETKWTVLDVVLGTEYLDTTAEKGVKYWYTVRGVSMDNTVLINSYNGTGWSMKPLETPVLTEAFNSATGVRVSWKANDGAVKYRLLRKNLTKNEEAWSTVAETTELTFIDTSAASASRYTYTVECIDSNGRICSAQGNPRTCTYIAMAKITEIKGVDNGVSLTWSKPAGAKNFRVFRKVDGENTWTALTDVQGTTYTDTTAEKGVKYWYTVRAITMDGKMYINSYNSYGWSVTRK
ncbi:MAG: leucine-rich repeat protein [Oscillospiraceae bacterium]|nr:leucine-rich repeat protein [Oscillospiraceae bacterium]